ncbi:MAG: hypothetical protein ACRCXZ_08620, partial [Patescibacteria group bacterium]
MTYINLKGIINALQVNIMSASNKYFNDGFPRDPHEVLEFIDESIFQEYLGPKDEWLEWLSLASQENIDEFVNTVHDLWIEKNVSVEPKTTESTPKSELDSNIKIESQTVNNLEAKEPETIVEKSEIIEPEQEIPAVEEAEEEIEEIAEPIVEVKPSVNPFAEQPKEEIKETPKEVKVEEPKFEKKEEARTEKPVQVNSNQSNNNNSNNSNNNSNNNNNSNSNNNQNRNSGGNNQNNNNQNRNNQQSNNSNNNNNQKQSRIEPPVSQSNSSQNMNRQNNTQTEDEKAIRIQDENDGKINYKSFDIKKVRETATKNELDVVYKKYLESKEVYSNSEKTYFESQSALFDKLMGIVVNFEQVADYFESM